MKKNGLGFNLQIMLAAAIISLPLLAVDQVDAQGAKQSPRAKWEETVRKAEKEGKLSIYMSRAVIFIKSFGSFIKSTQRFVSI